MQLVQTSLPHCTDWRKGPVHVEAAGVQHDGYGSSITAPCFGRRGHSKAPEESRKRKCMAKAFSRSQGEEANSKH